MIVSPPEFGLAAWRPLQEAAARARAEPLLQARRQGMTVLDIAVRFGLSKSRVWDILARHGEAGKARPKPPAPAPEPVLEARRQGLSMSAIAARCGLPKSRVWSILVAHGLAGKLKKPPERTDPPDASAPAEVRRGSD